MNRSTRKFALRGLLAAHFAPVRLEDLVITRHDFPHWMRPDLQKALEAIFAAMPRRRFFGARLRGGEPWFRFADLVEPGCAATYGLRDRDVPGWGGTGRDKRRVNRRLKQSSKNRSARGRATWIES